MKTVIAVDPGLSGAWAVLSDAGLTVGDLPVAGGKIAATEFARLIHAAAPDTAIVETVGAMPKQGLSSTWKFAEATGTVVGVIAALEVPLHRVAPTTWKKHFKLSSDKESARALAMRLWPSCRDFARKKDHGRAEAALMALYASQAALQFLEAA